MIRKSSSRVRWRGLIAALTTGLLWQVSGPITLADEEDPIVARVNQHEIRRSDIFASIESLPLAEQINMRKQMDLVVRSLVNEELLFQSVLSSRSEWERRLRQELKSQAVERMIRRHVKEQVEIEDQEIRDYYRANRDTLRGWHIRVRHIRLASRPECEEMLRQIDSEERFAEIAKVHSLDRTSASNGGDLGYIMYSPNNPLSLGFELELFEMAVGEMRIFDSEKGCHLMRVVEIDDPPDPPFERIREFLKPKLEQRRERELLQALLGRVSREARVEIVPPASK